MVRGTAVSLPVLGDSRVAQWRPMPELPQYRFLNPDEDEETSLSLESDSTRRDDAGVTRTGDATDECGFSLVLLLDCHRGAATL